MRPVKWLAVLVVSVLLSTLQAEAQLCQGSLGDPLANITFGAGTNAGSPLTAATTNYQFTANTCPNDGSYTVCNRTSGCFSNSWHTISSDHTGNTNGYFMLVNASYQPSAFYLDTVKGLCSNTTFEFAAWIINVLLPSACGGNGIQPNLTFTIEKTDGTVLQTYNSGNIPTQNSPDWRQIGFYFTTPNGVTDVVLRIVNNSNGGCGNDLALDDITFRPCGPDIIAAIQGLPGLNEAFCEGAAHQYVFNGSLMAGYTNPSLQWQQSIDGGNWTDINGENGFTMQKDFPAGTAPGVYQYRLSAAEAGNMGAVYCRTASKVIAVTINANPVTTAKSNSPVCAGRDLLLTATGGAQYDWTGVNGFSSTGAKVLAPDAVPAQSGKYYVTVTSNAGCTHLDSAMVTINPSPTASAGPVTSFICQGEQVQLNAGGGIRYQWIPGNGLSNAFVANPMASPSDTTDYSVVVWNGFGCSDTAALTVNVAALPAANAGPDKKIMKGDTVRLEGVANGQDVDFSWSPLTNMLNTNSLNPVVSPPLGADYILTVFSRLGCGTDIDTVHVFVYRDILVPNAFSPNRDGANEVWRVPALGAVKTFQLQVYNRYGQLLFQTSDPNKGWDGRFNGTDQPVGTYVYFINIDKGVRVLKGVFMLLR